MTSSNCSTLHDHKFMHNIIRKPWGSCFRKTVRRESRILRKGCQIWSMPTYNFAKFPKKLHEDMEKILIRGVGRGRLPWSTNAIKIFTMHTLWQYHQFRDKILLLEISYLDWKCSHPDLRGWTGWRGLLALGKTSLYSTTPISSSYFFCDRSLLTGLNPVQMMIVILKYVRKGWIFTILKKSR